MTRAEFIRIGNLGLLEPPILLAGFRQTTIAGLRFGWWETRLVYDRSGLMAVRSKDGFTHYVGIQFPEVGG